MASTFAFYLDAALTIPLTSSLLTSQNADGSSGFQDFQIWLGSNAVGKTLRADSNPGVDQLTLSVVDAASGSGQPASAIKLAATQGTLAAATGGASLNLGTTILSTVGLAVSFWVRLTDTTHVVGTYTDLSLTLNLARED